MKKFGDFINLDENEYYGHKREDTEQDIRRKEHDKLWKGLIAHEDLVKDFVDLLMNEVIEKSQIKFEWIVEKKEPLYELQFKYYSWPGSPAFFSEEAIAAYRESMKKIDEVYMLFKGGKGSTAERLGQKKSWGGTYNYRAGKQMDYSTMKVSEITHNGITTDGRKLCRLYGIDYWSIFEKWSHTVRGEILAKEMDIL